MLDRLRSVGLLLLVAVAVAPVAVSGDGSLSDLLPVAGRLPGSALVVVKLVDLLKSHVLGLVDEEPNEEHGDPSETTPDPEDVRLGRIESGSEVGSDERQEPVEKPVCGGGHGETLSASLQREQLSRNDPRGRAESRCEERDVDAEEDELCNCGCVVLGRVCSDARDRNDKLTRAHTQGTDE